MATLPPTQLLAEILRVNAQDLDDAPHDGPLAQPAVILDATLHNIRHDFTQATVCKTAMLNLCRQRLPAFNFQHITPDLADRWIAQLVKLNLFYHFDDDPAEVINAGGRVFTEFEVIYLREVIKGIREIPNFDPLEILMKQLEKDLK